MALLVSQVTLAALLFAVLQILAIRHNQRIDLTPGHRFTLSDQAVRVAGQVDRPIRIRVFYDSRSPERRRQMVDLLERFQQRSRHISFALHDLDRSPALAEKYGIRSYGSGVAETNERVVSLHGIDEQSVAGALLELTQAEQHGVCFLTGHGEKSPRDTGDRSGYSDVAKSLERERFRIRSLSTIAATGPPEECDVLVIAGPTHHPLPGEEEALSRHLRHGGRILLLLDPGSSDGFVDWAARNGAQPGNDVIVDERNRFFGADSFTPRIPIFDQQTYGDRLDSAAVFSLARTIRPRDQEPPTGARPLLLAITSDDSWAVVDPPSDIADDVRFREGIDRPGPLPAGARVLFERDDAPAGELIVFGDSDFASNFYLDLLGNRDLFMSTVAVLAREPELVAIRRKGNPGGTMSPITLTATQGRTIFWIGVVAQPAACVLLGLGVLLVRRGRRGGR